ncbi:MAG: sodium:proton antiporter, partial [Vibrio sp.]|nr:sodium:proton antiporter [Vibrio sp.]
MNTMIPRRTWLLLFCTLLFPSVALASSNDIDSLDLTHSTIGYASLVIFTLAYTLVMMEEYLKLRK